MNKRFFIACILSFVSTASADWKSVYTQSFDRLPDGTKTASRELPEWEGGSASGMVFDGKTLAEASLANVGSVAVIASAEQGEVFIGAGKDIYRLQSKSKPKKVATLGGYVTAMDYDPDRSELWVVVDAHRVVRLDAKLEVVQTYSDDPREWGAYDPTHFAGVYDIAADLKGGFFIGEPARAPRRIAQIARDGSVIGEWFGGMSFYIGGSFDPEDPTRLIGIAPEGSVNVYKIDYQKGSWKIEACYQTGRLGDGMLPFTGGFRAIRKNGQLYLYHRVLPAVVRLDPKLRRAVPVAIAGRVINRGRTFTQFAGSGRDGYPKPWVAAAEHHGFQDLKSAPKLYSWADANGDGKFDPVEFKFYSEAKVELSFHNLGDFKTNGDYVGTGKTNAPHAMVHLPVSRWEGPKKSAPRWDWNRAEPVGKVMVDNYGWGSPRGLTVGHDGAIAVTFQAGIMIRAHGQYEGGGWPEAGLKGSRILSFDNNFQPMFAVGRQSKNPADSNTGVLFYPMQTTSGPNNSVVVNDQTKQPAQVWTDDGLYIGGMFDNRADDGLADAFYQVHGDDNQGCTVVTTQEGQTYWLSPYQGHNRLFEISGWDDWMRLTGAIALTGSPIKSASEGTGLSAKYIRGEEVVLETVEPPIYYNKFSPERHSDKVKPHDKVEWTGYIEPPLTDRYQFHTILGKKEQIAIWIDGRLIHAAGFKPKQNIKKPIDLMSGHRHRIRIEYINPDGRAELNLLWSSRVLDHQRLQIERLYQIEGIE